MAKLTLNDPSGGINSAAQIIANNTLVEAAIENTLSRDGATPNAMGASLDMNSNRIINLPSPVLSSDAARLKDVQDASIVTQLPSQTGNANKLLTTDGSALGWNPDPNIQGSLQVDNLKLDLNTISSVSGAIVVSPVTNQPVTLEPAGTGIVYIRPSGTGNVQLTTANGNVVINPTGTIGLTSTGTVNIGPTAGGVTISGAVNNNVAITTSGTGRTTINTSRVLTTLDTLGVVRGAVLNMSPVVLSSSVTNAHGLGVIPHFVEVTLLCLIAEHGYSIGDVVHPIIGGTVNLGYSWAATSTTLWLHTNGVIYVLDKTTSVGAAITAAKWSISATPYAFNTLV